MDKHPLRDLWRQGQGALNGWAAIKLVTVGSDARYIMTGANAAVDAFRG